LIYDFSPKNQNLLISSLCKAPNHFTVSSEPLYYIYFQFLVIYGLFPFHDNITDFLLVFTPSLFVPFFSFWSGVYILFPYYLFFIMVILCKKVITSLNIEVSYYNLGHYFHLTPHIHPYLNGRLNYSFSKVLIQTTDFIIQSIKSLFKWPTLVFNFSSLCLND